MQNTIRNHSRIVFLDLLRTLCCFLVVVNHTYDYISLPNVSSAQRTFSFFTMMFSNIAVPIFLMISGCTLLTKTDSIRKTLERFIRIAIVLVLFSFVYEVYAWLTGQLDCLSIKHFLNAVYTWNISLSYWYLYAYTGLMLMLPFLQKLAQSMSARDFLLFLGLSVFFHGIWPIVVEYTPVSAYCAHFALPLFTEHIFYMFLGYYLFIHSPRKLPLPLCLAGLLICPALSAFAVEAAFAASRPYLYLDNIALFPVIVTALCAFSLAQRIRIDGLPARIAGLLGQASFGAYLVSDLFIALYTPALAAMRTAMHPFIAVTLFQLLIFASSLIAGLLLKRLPLLRKLL